jgi:hypothetical protein
MSPFDAKPTSSFSFSNMLPSKEKEDTFSDTLPFPSDSKEDVFSNSLPAYASDEETVTTFSNTLPTSPAPEEALTPADLRTARRLLFSHVAALIFAVPTLILVAVDLHSYTHRPRITPVFRHGQFSTPASLLILDIMSLILLSLTLLYAVVYLKLRLHGKITPAFLRRFAIPIFLLDGFLCVGVQALSDTIIGMRTGSEVTGCQRFEYLDVGACEGWRRTVLRAAGACGIVAR